MVFGLLLPSERGVDQPETDMPARISLLFCLLTSLVCCHEKNLNDSKAVKEELRSRKPIHLTKVQIDERALQLADTLLLKSEIEFLVLLKASKYTSCVPVFQHFAESLKLKYGATLNRIPFDSTRLKAISSAKEKEVIDACFYNRESHLRIDPNLQKDGDKDFIYSKALVLKDAKCVSCHATSKTPILRANLKDTLGIWSLRLTKKQVVMSFVD